MNKPILAALVAGVMLLAGCSSAAAPDTEPAAVESEAPQEVVDDVGIGGTILPTTVDISEAEAADYVIDGLDAIFAALPPEAEQSTDTSMGPLREIQTADCYGQAPSSLYVYDYASLPPDTDVEALLDDLYSQLNGQDGWVGGKMEFDPGQTIVALSKESGLRVTVELWNETLPSIAVMAQSPCFEG